MKYMGSKSKYANEIISVIKNDLGDLWVKDNFWIEPFVGGANIIDKVGDYFNYRIGNDINIHIIEMFKALQLGWIPPDNVSENDYKLYKEKAKYTICSIDSPLIGFVGIGCSYGGKWFGGYARGDDRNGNPRNYCYESKNNLLKQKKNILGVTFISFDYRKIEIPPTGIIYCDPPYEHTTRYKNSFNHTEFWDWCNRKIESGYNVYVSEYNAPKDWECIWYKKVNNSLTKDTGAKKGIEKLFTKKIM